MKNKAKDLKTIGLTLMLLLVITSLCGQTAEQQEIIDDGQSAKQAFIEQDSHIESLFNNSEGYVIFPNVGKGAYIVGGASGNGAVYENGALIGMADLKQLDVGLQLGGQAFRQVIFFGNQNVLQEFKEGNFELAANASAVALEKGTARSLKFKDGVAVATMPKAGAMIEVSVGGQKFEFQEF